MLAEARGLGFLGPGPVEDHIEHAERFLEAAPRAPGAALDLGSGGGVPGLVLASRWPASRWTLLDVSLRRTTFLGAAVRSLALGDRVEVVRARAEEAGRDPSLSATFDLVVARSFARPATTAECASAFLRIGGSLLVSEPPGSEGERWTAGELAPLGLTPQGCVQGIQRLDQTSAPEARFPRSFAAMRRRPLF